MGEPYLYISAAAGGGVSLVCILGIIWSFLTTPRLRKHPYSLVILRDVSDAGFVVSLFIAAWEKGDDCTGESTALHFFLIASLAWYSVTIFDLWLSFRDPFFQPSVILRSYHMFAWGMSALSAALINIVDAAGETAFGLCWIKKHGSRINIYTWLLFFAPLVIVLVASLAVVAYVYRNNQTAAPTLISFATRQRTLRFSMIYVFSYAMYWTVVGVLYIITAMNDFESEGLVSLVTIALSSRGLMDAVLWVYCNRSLPSTSTSFGKLISQASSTVFRRSSAVRASTTSERRTPRAEDENAEIRKIMDEEMNFQAALRSDILHATSHGILLAVNSAPLAIPRDHTRFAPDEYTHKAVSQQIWTPVEDSDKGIRYCFIDYAPAVFNALRTMWGCGSDSYVRSFGQRVDGNWRIVPMIERASAGKSGAFFYYSYDRRFIVKTLSKGESKTLRRILPQYHSYMSLHPNSLLSRYHGLHSVRIYSKKMYFIVLDNLFPTRAIHTVYDLKGSWVHRRTGTYAAKRMSLPLPTLSSPTSPKRRVFKDTDFRLRNEKLSLAGDTAEALAEQIRSDAQFMSGCGIMDYSLLLGVHDPTQLASRSTIKSRHQITSQQEPTAGTDTCPPLPPAHSSPSRQQPSASLPTATVEDGEPVAVNRRSLSSGPTRVSPAAVQLDLEVTEEQVGGEQVEIIRYDAHRSVSLPRNLVRDLLAHSEGLSEVTQAPPHKYRPLDYGLPALNEKPRDSVTSLPDSVIDKQEGLIYYIGIIDTLQDWNMSKRVESAGKIFCLNQNRKGLSAVPPQQYADRFAQRMDEILLGHTSSSKAQIPKQNAKR